MSNIIGSNKVLTNIIFCAGFPINGAELVLKLGATDGVNVKNDNEDTSVEVRKILNPQRGHLYYWYKEKNKTVHKWCLDKILKDNLSLFKRTMESYEDEIENEKQR